MPSVNINDLLHVIPRYHGQAIEPDISFLYPDLVRLKLTGDCLELEDKLTRRIQRFRIVWGKRGIDRKRCFQAAAFSAAGT